MGKNKVKHCRVETREFIEWAEGRGWSVERTKNNHLRLVHPEVPKVLFTGGTLSDYRGWANNRAMLRRYERQYLADPPK